MFDTGAINTKGKFAASIVDTVSKVATGVLNTGGVLSIANFQKISGAWGKRIHEKILKENILWHRLFNQLSGEIFNMRGRAIAGTRRSRSLGSGSCNCFVCPLDVSVPQLVLLSRYDCHYIILLGHLRAHQATGWKFFYETWQEPGKCVYCTVYMNCVLFSPLMLKSEPDWPAITVSRWQQ